MGSSNAEPQTSNWGQTGKGWGSGSDNAKTATGGGWGTTKDEPQKSTGDGWGSSDTTKSASAGSGEFLKGTLTLTSSFYRTTKP